MAGCALHEFGKSGFLGGDGKKSDGNGLLGLVIPTSQGRDVGHPGLCDFTGEQRQRQKRIPGE